MENYDFTVKPCILIQGAMDTETEYLIGQLKEMQKVSMGNWIFCTGFLGKYEEPVVISKTYQGMVNAAAASSLALVKFKPKAVINQGIAGGHDLSFHRGDIVLGEKVIPMGAMIREFEPEGAGISETEFKPLPIEVYHARTGTTEKVTEFPCDEKILRIAECVETTRSKGRGVLGSADEWNNQIDRIALFREKYHTASEDMESAAAAQLCFSYGIPFLGIRILSNSIVHGEEFDESVGIEGQKFVVQLVEALHGV